MIISLLGTGKTGSQLLELTKKQNISCHSFNSKNPPTLEKLQESDVIVSFLPGHIFETYIDLILSSKKPLVCGSTGQKWPKDLDQTLKKNKTTWIHGRNFSLGMLLVKEMIQTLKKSSTFYDDYQFDLHEIHHTKKIDAPSGTALAMEEWLGEKCSISSERIGDVVGDHQLILKTPNEEIKLQHQAKNRQIFAEGALWMAKRLLSCQYNNGLFTFESVALGEKR